jgi:uncharacterized RDD family membrane protein YckC/Tfp pilus assembly protein PilE
MNKIHTHYDNLKVSRNAPDEVIRAVYRVLAQKYHPDRNPGDLDAARIMTLVNASYKVLSDPVERRNHDRWIEEQEFMAAQTDAPKQAASEPPPPPPVNERPASNASAQAQASELSRRYAGFWKRLTALILDNLVFFALFVLIWVVIDVVGGKFNKDLVDLVSIPLFWLYFAFMESSAKQATLGKMALGIKVVDLQGNRISFWRASGRSFAKIVSYITLLIGYLMAAFTQRKQALHDMMAGCLVVNKAVEPSELQQAGSASKMSTGANLALVIAWVIVGSIPIVGILAAMALPAYQDYTVRAKMAEVVGIGDQATKAVEEFIVENNAIPSEMEQTGFSTTSRYVEVVIVDGQNGVVALMTAFSPIANKVLLFVPSLDKDNKIVWECSSEDIPIKYLPQRCR